MTRYMHSDEMSPIWTFVVDPSDPSRRRPIMSCRRSASNSIASSATPARLCASPSPTVRMMQPTAAPTMSA